jgi:hypothetical protein
MCGLLERVETALEKAGMVPKGTRARDAIMLSGLRQRTVRLEPSYVLCCQNLRAS